MEKCNHRDIKGNLTIKYDSAYEMRSSDMHCTQCGECGTREELESIEIKEKIIKNKIEPLKYKFIDTSYSYDIEYTSYPNADILTHKINEIIEYINKEDE